MGNQLDTKKRKVVTIDRKESIESEMFFEEIPTKKGTFFILKSQSDNSLLPFYSFLSLILSGGHLLTSILQQFNSSFYFECLPINKDSLTSYSFQFVIIPAPELDNLQLDEQSFQNKFDSNLNSNEKVISFNNLGGDASLVVPCPIEGDNDCMRNLYTFIQRAPEDLIEAFWKKAGKKMLERLEENPTRPIWLSTSGAGVYWLHLRLDSNPKYYNWRPYKVWPLDKSLKLAQQQEVEDAKEQNQTVEQHKGQTIEEHKQQNTEEQVKERVEQQEQQTVEQQDQYTEKQVKERVEQQEEQNRIEGQDRNTEEQIKERVEQQEGQDTEESKVE